MSSVHFKSINIKTFKNKIQMERLNESWLNGKYEISHFNVEINNSNSSVYIEDVNDEDVAWLWQHNEAEDIIETICNRWNAGNKTIEDVIYDWMKENVLD